MTMNVSCDRRCMNHDLLTGEVWRIEHEAHECVVHVYVMQFQQMRIFLLVLV